MWVNNTFDDLNFDKDGTGCVTLDEFMDALEFTDESTANAFKMLAGLDSCLTKGEWRKWILITKNTPDIRVDFMDRIYGGNCAYWTTTE